jgi:hypothetical protein
VTAREALKVLLEEAQNRGMPWWTSDQINHWERGRRGIRLDECKLSDSQKSTLNIISDSDVEQAVIYLPLDQINEHDTPEKDLVHRWGVTCRRVVLNICKGENKYTILTNETVI